MILCNCGGTIAELGELEGTNPCTCATDNIKADRDKYKSLYEAEKARREAAEKLRHICVICYSKFCAGCEMYKDYYAKILSHEKVMKEIG